jgi:hypothetical protein
MLDLAFGILKESGVSGLLLYLMVFVSTYCPGLVILLIQHPNHLNKPDITMTILLPLVYTLPLLMFNTVICSWHGIEFEINPQAPLKDEFERRSSYFLFAGSIANFMNLWWSLILVWIFQRLNMPFSFNKLIVAIIISESSSIIALIWDKNMPKLNDNVFAAANKDAAYYLCPKCIKFEYNNQMEQTIIQTMFNCKLTKEGIDNSLPYFLELEEIPTKRIKQSTHSYICLLFTMDGRMRYTSIQPCEGDAITGYFPISAQWENIPPNTIHEKLYNCVLKHASYKTKIDKWRRINTEFVTIPYLLYLGYLYLYLTPNNTPIIYIGFTFIVLLLFCFYKGSMYLIKRTYTKR